MMKMITIAAGLACLAISAPAAAQWEVDMRETGGDVVLNIAGQCRGIVERVLSNQHADVSEIFAGYDFSPGDQQFIRSICIAYNQGRIDELQHRLDELDR